MEPKIQVSETFMSKCLQVGDTRNCFDPLRLLDVDGDQ